MSIELQNFTPALNYTLAATTTSQNTAITQPASAAGVGLAGSGGGYVNLRIYNATAAVAFISWGMSAQTATVAASFPVGPGASPVINMGCPATNVGCILSAGTGNVYFSPGGGS